MPSDEQSTPQTTQPTRDIHADSDLVEDCCGDIHCDGKCLMPKPNPDLHYGARCQQS